MKKIIVRCYQVLTIFGIDPLQFLKSIAGIPFYFRDLFKLVTQGKITRDFKFGIPYPILSDRFSDSGVMSGHYFHQDLYVARRVYEQNPKNILDIGSRTDGYVAHIAVFREIDVVDIRDQKSNVKNINFKRADIMKPHKNIHSSYHAVSCLHSVEHFGLGRYGDEVNYNGHLVALDNIYSILKRGGRFYFSTPIGNQRIEFNGHRVFSIKYLLKIFQDKYDLERFSYIDDNGNFYENVQMNDFDKDNNFGCDYGCGIFELIKK